MAPFQLVSHLCTCPLCNSPHPDRCRCSNFRRLQPEGHCSISSCDADTPYCKLTMRTKHPIFHQLQQRGSHFISSRRFKDISNLIPHILQHNCTCTSVQDACTKFAQAYIHVHNKFFLISLLIFVKISYKINVGAFN